MNIDHILQYVIAPPLSAFCGCIQSLACAGESGALSSSNFSIDTLEDLLKHKKRHKELIYGRYGVVTSPEYDPVRRTYVLLARDCRSESRELVCLLFFRFSQAQSA